MKKIKKGCEKGQCYKKNELIVATCFFADNI